MLQWSFYSAWDDLRCFIGWPFDAALLIFLINVAVCHYYNSRFCEALEKGLWGGHKKQPPLLMPIINRGGHFLLTEAVMKTASELCDVARHNNLSIMLHEKWGRKYKC